MARADAGAVVAVEVLVEKDQIAPVRVLLKSGGAAVQRPAVVLAQEDQADPPRDLIRHLPERHLLTGAGGALHGERVTKVRVHLPEGLNQQLVDRQPDWAPPIRVSP